MMITVAYAETLPKRILVILVGVCLCQGTFALEELSDDRLAETTGEGIAILPQNTYMVFRGSGSNETVDQILTDRSHDLGYINYIPVGPLSMTAADTNRNGKVDSDDLAVGKADLYLYGLAISKSDNDTNTRIASSQSAAAISSWGTVVNPWIFKVSTDQSVPNFGESNCNGPSDITCQLTYLALEAPLYEVGEKDPEGIDAYKLKLGLWSDIFVRNPNRINGEADQFQYGNSNGHIGTSIDSSRANRLRLQGIWNNFSLNGSRIQLFQTLGGATSNGGMSPFYNNTLGFSGVIRLNSGDASNLKATYSSSDPEVINRSANIYSTTYTGTPHENPTAEEKYRFRAIGLTVNASGSWTAPNDSAMENVLRFSTKESGSGQNYLSTPALHGGNAPTFDPNEGLFLYNPNINLVLGGASQPLIVGSDGKNFSLEIARIPNKPEVYKRIYTNYDDINPLTNGGYYGSTCNVYQCGGNISLGGKLYQGTSASHSSISIGTTIYNSNTNTLEAFKGNTNQDAIGVSFGKLPTGTTNLTSSNSYYQMQYQVREISPYTVNVSCGWFCTRTETRNDRWKYAVGIDSNGNINSWADGGDAGKGEGGIRFDSKGAVWINVAQITTGYNAQDYAVYESDTRPQFANPFVVSSTPNALAALPGVQYNNGTWTTNQPPSGDINHYRINSQKLVPNNFGSVVIDGLLIQHLKLTTKGL